LIALQDEEVKTSGVRGGGEFAQGEWQAPGAHSPTRIHLVLRTPRAVASDKAARPHGSKCVFKFNRLWSVPILDSGAASCTSLLSALWRFY